MAQCRPINAVVVEDERLAREEIKRMLAEDPRIAVIAEAADLAGARALLQRIRPHVLFLDVQLGDGCAFELFNDAQPDYAVVFTTAYESFALRAFEIDAVDYLLKPIQRDRLRSAVDRVSVRASDHVPAMRLAYEDTLFLRLQADSVFLPVKHILAVVAEGDYTRVSATDGRQHQVPRSLKHWESRLPEQVFARIHRSTIVNLQAIKRLEPWLGQAAYRVFVEGLAKPLMLSRRHAIQLNDRFGC